MTTTTTTTPPLSLSLGAPKATTSLPIVQQPATAGAVVASSPAVATTVGAVTEGPTKPEAVPIKVEEPQPVQPQKPAFALPDVVYQAYASEEQRIGSLRGSTLHTSSTTAGRRAATSSHKRPKLLAPTVHPCTMSKEEYTRTQRVVTTQLILYLQYYRQSRHRYWRLLEESAQTASKTKKTAMFGAIQDPDTSAQRSTLQCHSCTKRNDDDDEKGKNNNERWDQLLQCLECSHVGCLDGEQHSYEHWLATGHNYGTYQCICGHVCYCRLQENLV